MELGMWRIPSFNAQSLKQLEISSKAETVTSFISLSREIKIISFYLSNKFQLLKFQREDSYFFLLCDFRSDGKLNIFLKFKAVDHTKQAVSSKVGVEAIIFPIICFFIYFIDQKIDLSTWENWLYLKQSIKRMSDRHWLTSVTTLLHELCVHIHVNAIMHWHLKNKWASYF